MPRGMQDARRKRDLNPVQSEAPGLSFWVLGPSSGFRLPSFWRVDIKGTQSLLNLDVVWMFPGFDSLVDLLLIQQGTYQIFRGCTWEEPSVSPGSGPSDPSLLNSVPDRRRRTGSS